MKNVISTDKAPAAIGPYSQAIEVNGMVYTSGIIPVVPTTGEIPEGSVAQAKQAFENLSNLLEAAGTSMDKVVKTTVFIKEMNDFGAINEVYAEFSIILVMPSLIVAFMSNALSNIFMLTDCVREEVSENCRALSAELTFVISIGNTSCNHFVFLNIIS